ncbi:MAG: Tic22 family protein [Leptolyngbyaceae bacterium]|nr:Tic22 family protein [Leptolyngbyaceae bacterium]
MKSFLRWGATVLAVSGAVVGSWIAPGLRAFGLTQAEIEAQLRGIPVFTITDPAGNPFVAVIPTRNENGEPTGPNTVITEVFISADDAEASLAAFQEANPELGSNAQVTPVSLARIYKAALEARTAEDQLQFYFVPMVEEVAHAVSLLPEDAQASPGVPLFMLSSIDPATAATTEDQISVTLLTLQNGEDEIIPLFFTQEQYETALSAIDGANPAFRENLQVEVIWLGDYIRGLELAESGNIEQYRMIPLADSIDYVESFQPNPTSATPAPTNATEPAPAAPTPDTPAE